jgi:hypothetical protein
MQLIDDRGLADAGIARDQHQLRSTALDDTVEGGEQGLDLARPPVQFLGDQQPVGRVVLAQWEVVDGTLGFPFGQAAPQIALNTARGLIALLGRLSEHLQDNRRDGAGDVLQPLAGRHRLRAIWQWIHPWDRTQERQVTLVSI